MKKAALKMGLTNTVKLSVEIIPALASGVIILHMTRLLGLKVLAFCYDCFQLNTVFGPNHNVVHHNYSETRSQF